MNLNSVVWCDRGWQPVEYCFCPSEEAWDKQLKRMGITGEPYPDSDGRATIFTKDGKTIALVQELLLAMKKTRGLPNG